MQQADRLLRSWWTSCCMSLSGDAMSMCVYFCARTHVCVCVCEIAKQLLHEPLSVAICIKCKEHCDWVAAFRSKLCTSARHMDMLELQNVNLCVIATQAFE